MRTTLLDYLERMVLVLLLIALHSCNKGAEKQRTYSSSDQNLEGTVGSSEISVLDSPEIWVQILEVLPARGECEGRITADVYKGVFNQEDTLLVLVPCADYLHDVGMYAQFIEFGEMADTAIYFSSSTGNLDPKYKKVFGDLIFPKE